MATVQLTKDDFQATVADNEIVFIDFWAEWCGPCRMFAPIFEKVSEEHSDITFAKVDTEAQTELAAAFNIMSIPTLMILREGIVLYSQAGALPEAALQDLINQVRGLDMAKVRAELNESN